MAAPADKTINNMTGKWVLNKKFSDSSDPVLAVQGMGFLARKGLNMANIVVEINQYVAPAKEPNTSGDAVTYIDITQSPSGLKSNHESRCVDNIFRERSDGPFGSVRAKNLWVGINEISDGFLKKDWLVEGDDGKLILGQVESVNDGWVLNHICGFKMVDGERRYCRNLVVTKGEKRVEAQLAYDFVSN